MNFFSRSTNIIPFPTLNNYLGLSNKSLDYNYLYLYNGINTDTDNNFFLKKALNIFYNSFNKNIVFTSNYSIQPISFILNTNLYSNMHKDIN